MSYANKKFGREKSQRQALLISLAESLVENGQIRTTETKAKALRPFIEKAITKAKNGDQQARRLLESRLGGRRQLADTLVDEIAPRFADRSGGYTRIVKLPPRKSDASYEAIIQFVDHEIEN